MAAPGHAGPDAARDGRGWLKNWWTRKKPEVLQGTMDQKRRRVEERLKEFAEYANANYKVQELCGSFRARVEALVERRGDRLPT